MQPYLHHGYGDSSAGTLYELYAILVHHGSAYGGHYFALIKPPGSDHWCEFNDRSVTRVSDDDMEAAFAAAKATPANGADTGNAGAAADPASGAGSHGGTGDKSEAAQVPDRIAQALSANAYILFYRRATDGAAAQPSDASSVLPPSDVVAEVEAENEAHARLRRLHDIRQRMVELVVFEDGAADRKVWAAWARCCPLRELAEFGARSSTSCVCGRACACECVR